VSRFDEFNEHLEAALDNPDERDALVDYLQSLTREQRAELLAEAEARTSCDSKEWAQEIFDSTLLTDNQDLKKH
jgi:hypothetical protein